MPGYAVGIFGSHDVKISGEFSGDHMAHVVDSDLVELKGTFRGPPSSEAVVIEGKNGRISVAEADFEASPARGKPLKRYVRGWRPPEEPVPIVLPRLKRHLLRSTAIWLFRN